MNSSVNMIRRAFATGANPKVFFDVKIGTKPAGRIVFEVRP
jgi:hypothetical protein